MANVRKCCAACSHQRRRCTENCPLAPHFPMDKKDDFLKVHKLYGTSRFTKLIESFPSSERSRIAENIVKEAGKRELNPEQGIIKEANQLVEEINLTKKLINDVQRDTEFIKNVIEIEKDIDELDRILESDPLEILPFSSSFSMEENENEKAGPSSAAETSHVAK